VVKIIARLELDETISFPDGHKLKWRVGESEMASRPLGYRGPMKSTTAPSSPFEAMLQSPRLLAERQVPLVLA